ncbi:DEAD/DEAH box helicase [Nocardia jejuensis]|uniref:DEAD/DEAH box helicase n=1 Tax=Nocardia jejuensis TaxID=328049 RepID=UPI000AFE50C2|nr:DEAD/DEAH box helicase [Nocardia jejuensis]
MLHGLWSPGSGLVLWHDPDGDAATAVETGALPDPLGALVRAAKFRHRAQVLVPGPYGPQETQVRAHALAPEAAAKVLLQELPSGIVAGDLRFLAHVARGVDRWVRAGRIVLEVRRDDGDWWVRWRLVGGQRQRAWLAELAVAMPAALKVAGRAPELLESFVAELADPMTRLRIAARLPALPPPIGTGSDERGSLGSRAHPLISALLESAPLEEGSHRVAAVLEQWRTSLTVDEPELVLRLVEPDTAEPEGAAADGALWRLEVCLRTEGEAPAPVLLPGDPAMVRIAGERLADAKQAYPRLRDLPGDSRSMDLFLPTEVVMDLVAHGAQVLQAAGVRLMLPRAWRIAAPTMRLQVQSPAATESAVGLKGLVSFRWELAVGDTVLSPAEMARLVRSKSDLVQIRGEWIQADHRMLAAAADYVSGRTDGTETTIGGLFAELAANPVTKVPLAEITATGWAAELFDGEKSIEPVADPVGLKAQLRPYQQRGLTWLATMSRLGCGAILADDMGLGKTVQVLALLVHEREEACAAKGSSSGETSPVSAPGRPAAGAGAERRKIRRTGALDPATLFDELEALADGRAESGTAPVAVGDVGPTLLVCPMSVVGNWQRETQRFAPDLRVLVHHGPARRSGAEFDAAVRESDLVITTYALLARDVEELKRQNWQRVVVDEAQHIKNAGTRQAKAARAVPARHRLALTGTPVENRLEELRSILDFANPALLGKPSEFHARFAVPIERERDENAVTRLRAITSPFVLRRVKTDPAVISDLPDKIEITVRANLTAEQAALYQAVLDDMTAKLKDAKGMERKGAVLAALTRLKQVCNHPAHYLSDGSALLRRGHHRSGKLALVEDILESVIADGERALLFTQFAEFGTLIAPYLTERFGSEVPFLHGGVGKQRRDEMVTRFQEDPDSPPLMLLSLKAGGTGLNLTAANHVVHLDRWWNPAVENQATDRAFRIGQRRDVQVRKLVCVDTIEERVDDMLRGKSRLADLTVTAGEKWITEMDNDELRELFALGSEAVGE